MNKQLENKTISEAIWLLEEGRYSERKPLLKELHDKGEVEINGYCFQKRTYCWIVWKPTDFDKNPEYKGSPLCKVVPRIHWCNTREKIIEVLESQCWVYM